MTRAIACLLTLLTVLPGCQTTGDAGAADPRFVIRDDGGFGDGATAALRAELLRGLAALDELGFRPRPGLLPVTVILRSGPGISNSRHGAGPITLFHFARNRAPTVHELTHMVAGYTRANSHWSQEGLASYVQDRFGTNTAYPTYGETHGIVRMMQRNGDMLPMRAVLQARDRQAYFGISNPIERWAAYAQSASFVRWLVETQGGMDRFRRIYDRKFEDTDFQGVYGSSADALIAAWQDFLRSAPPTVLAESLYAERKRFITRSR
jgi:hypothetical protein